LHLLLMPSPHYWYQGVGTSVLPSYPSCLKKTLLCYDGYTGSLLHCDIFMCGYIHMYVCVCVCMYVLYPKVVHLLHYFHFYLSLLLMVISAGLNVPYSYLSRK
jgi:hypothetical protein